MKLHVIQPPYPKTPDEYDRYARFIRDELAGCDGSLDLILLPEACNAPSIYPNHDEFLKSIRTNTGPLLDEVRKTAIRCKAMIAVNLITESEQGLRNTTTLYGRDGTALAEYHKQHLPVLEKHIEKLDAGYTYDYNPPVITVAEGVRIGFLTCYDLYFNEYCAHMASKQPDIILVPAHQRGERPEIIEMQARNWAFTCNAYLLRASVSMGADSGTGGCSLLAAPDGRLLKNLQQETGSFSIDVDIRHKHTRPNGYGQPEIRNDTFIENGRTPWCYRACGSMVQPSDSDTSYPRICAHRGFTTVAPENTMPALAAAVSLGADEIEIDLWPTADGEFVICHDDTVDRVSDGTGLIREMTWDEISRLDFGVKFSEAFRGLHIPRFEDVLKAFSRQVIINLHIKSYGKVLEYDPDHFKKIIGLIERYDCSDHVYIAGEEDVLRTALRLAPEMKRCCIDGTQDYTLVETAMQYQCQKIQLFRDRYTADMIRKARSHGIRCNFFWSDDPEEAAELLESGVDTLLTNDYLRVAKALGKYEAVHPGRPARRTPPNAPHTAAARSENGQG